MNKIMIITISIISFSLFGSQALAMENIDLSDSDFFYGEVAVDTTPGNELPARVNEVVELPDGALTASGFFYGQPINDKADILNNNDLPKRTIIAVPANNEITPDVFYGYTDALESTPCMNC